VFRLSAHDNGLYFFRGRPDVTRCVSCSALTNKWGEDLSRVPIPKKIGRDFSYSYDGVLVASSRVVACLQTHPASITPLDSGWFALRPEAVVAFDSVKRKTRFVKQCTACGQYESVVGATPVYLQPGAVVPDDGLARTDLEFGSGDEKTPTVLCGDAMASRLSAAGLRGFELVEIG
jgi:hypothetical protein